MAATRPLHPHLPTCASTAWWTRTWTSCLRRCALTHGALMCQHLPTMCQHLFSICSIYLPFAAFISLFATVFASIYLLLAWRIILGSLKESANTIFVIAFTLTPVENTPKLAIKIFGFPDVISICFFIYSLFSVDVEPSI